MVYLRVFKKNKIVLPLPSLEAKKGKTFHYHGLIKRSITCNIEYLKKIKLTSHHILGYCWIIFIFVYCSSTTFKNFIPQKATSMKEMQSLNDPLKNLKNLRKGILISGFFIVLPFFFYYDTSSMRGIIGELDGLLYNFPHRLFSIMLLKRGDIPLWNPYILCGFPQLAALQPAALYLPNIFFLSIFSPIIASTWSSFSIFLVREFLPTFTWEH